MIRSTALLTGSMALVLWSSPGSHPGDGPLRVPENVHGWAISVPVGEPFTDGFEALYFDTTSDVRIDAVDIVPGDIGLEVVGVRMAGNDRAAGLVQYFPTFPPESDELGPLLDPIGATFPPVPGEIMPHWELLIGLRLTSEERVGRQGLAISYSVDGVAYRETLPAFLAVCPGIDSQRCPLGDPQRGMTLTR